MYAPNVLALWGLLTLAALMIATGTLALLAIFGSIGQLLAMLLLVYLSLASSGGTVPIEALPGFFGSVGHVEPLATRCWERARSSTSGRAATPG
jgi:uncharacterized phage infection (PIP) family protein YhgE